MTDRQVAVAAKLSDLLSDAIRGLQEEGAVKPKKMEPDPEPEVIQEDDKKENKPEGPKQEPVRPPPGFERPDWRALNSEYRYSGPRYEPHPDYHYYDQGPPGPPPNVGYGQFRPYGYQHNRGPYRGYQGYNRAYY